MLFTSATQMSNSTLAVVVLPNNTMQCLCDGQPTTNCSVKYGTDSTYCDLPNTDSAMEDGVITLTSTLTGNTTYYIVSTMNLSLTMRYRGSFNTCNTHDLRMSNITIVPESNCYEPNGDDLLACYSGVTPGSTAAYYCGNGSFAGFSRCSSRMCQSDGTWNGTTSSCDCIGKLSSQSGHTRIGRVMVKWQMQLKQKSRHKQYFNCMVAMNKMRE